MAALDLLVLVAAVAVCPFIVLGCELLVAVGACFVDMAVLFLAIAFIAACPVVVFGVEFLVTGPTLFHGGILQIPTCQHY